MPLWHYITCMMQNASYYGKMPTRMDLAEMRQDHEDSFHKVYTTMLDYIALLEDKVRILERRNRELRGQVAKQKHE